MIVSKCKYPSSSRHFQSGKGPSGGLLRVCENRWIVCSATKHFSSLVRRSSARPPAAVFAPQTPGSFTFYEAAAAQHPTSVLLLQQQHSLRDNSTQQQHCWAGCCHVTTADPAPPTIPTWRATWWAPWSSAMSARWELELTRAN